jgi:hypothetical protein
MSYSVSVVAVLCDLRDDTPNPLDSIVSFWQVEMLRPGR